jgi:hypothetical protein
VELETQFLTQQITKEVPELLTVTQELQVKVLMAVLQMLFHMRLGREAAEVLAERGLQLQMVEEQPGALD